MKLIDNLSVFWTDVKYHLDAKFAFLSVIFIDLITYFSMAWLILIRYASTMIFITVTNMNSIPFIFWDYEADLQWKRMTVAEITQNKHMHTLIIKYYIYPKKSIHPKISIPKK